jgi:hypothetical protein
VRTSVVPVLRVARDRRLRCDRALLPGSSHATIAGMECCSP